MLVAGSGMTRGDIPMQPSASDFHADEIRSSTGLVREDATAGSICFARGVLGELPRIPDATFDGALQSYLHPCFNGLSTILPSINQSVNSEH